MSAPKHCAGRSSHRARANKLLRIRHECCRAVELRSPHIQVEHRNMTASSLARLKCDAAIQEDVKDARRVRAVLMI